MVLVETNEILTLCISLISLVLSIFTFIVNLKIEKAKDFQNRVNLTISEFERLQKEVFDQLNQCTNRDIANVITHYKADDCYRDLYNLYRSQIAKCEHFAVGVNSNVFVFDIVDRMAGKYIIFLFEKVEPIIQESRANSYDKKIYCEFESLYKRLKESNDMD